jgi:hypothetical protein
MAARKPALHLVNPRTLAFAGFAALFRRLKGRPLTGAEDRLTGLAAVAGTRGC